MIFLPFIIGIVDLVVRFQRIIVFMDEIESIGDIKLLVLDVDGVLTDGMYHQSSDGVTAKTFYTRDFEAICRLKKYDIDVLILTQSFGRCILKKLERLVTEWKDHISVRTRSDDKETTLSTFLAEKKLTWSNVAYVGDSLNDYDAMMASQFAACPFDAVKKVKDDAAHYVSEATGGHGCVYDVIEYILSKRN